MFWYRKRSAPLESKDHVMLRTQGYLRVKEAAALLGVSPNTVRAWGAAGQDHRIPAPRQPLPDVQAGRPGTGQSADRTLGHATRTAPTPVGVPADNSVAPANHRRHPCDEQCNWTTVTESKYPWERDALEFIRQQFPPHEPYRAWANFEFIADDGSINEVDLLLFTPQGFFLPEIKSRPGRLFGDAGTWTWETDGKLSTVDSPLIAANLKAKKLASLLQRQKAFQKKGRVPFIEALVFCSAPDLVCELQGNARLRVCLRDRDKEGDKPARPGIMAAVMRRDCPGLDPSPKGTHDRPMAKIIAQAMNQAGIHASQRHRKVSDYLWSRSSAKAPATRTGRPSTPRSPTPAAGSACTWSAPGLRPKSATCVNGPPSGSSNSWKPSNTLASCGPTTSRSTNSARP